MVARSSTSRLSLQGICALAALMMAGILMVVSHQSPISASLLRDGSTESPLDVWFDHTGSATLAIAVTTGKTPALMDVHLTSEKSGTLRIPDTWTLRQVRAATVDEITLPSDTHGFRRWNIPPDAVLSFNVPSLPPLLLHHTDGIPLLVTYKTVNIETGKTEESSRLTSTKPVLLK